MRRKDRAITDPHAIAGTLASQNVCRVALHGEPYPYIVPLNYGMVREGERITLYMHCAHEGEKLRRMQANAHVAFEVDDGGQLMEQADGCNYTMLYESVMGCGTLRVVEGEEKRVGLLALMHQIAPEKTFAFSDDQVNTVTMLRLDVEQMTGKRHRNA